MVNCEDHSKNLGTGTVTVVQSLSQGGQHAVKVDRNKCWREMVFDKAKLGKIALLL